MVNLKTGRFRSLRLLIIAQAVPQAPYRASGLVQWHEAAHTGCPLVCRLLRVKRTCAGEDVIDAIDPKRTPLLSFNKP